MRALGQGSASLSSRLATRRETSSSFLDPEINTFHCSEWCRPGMERLPPFPIDRVYFGGTSGQATGLIRVQARRVEEVRPWAECPVKSPGKGAPAHIIACQTSASSIPTHLALGSSSARSHKMPRIVETHSAGDVIRGCNGRVVLLISFSLDFDFRSLSQSIHDRSCNVVAFLIINALDEYHIHSFLVELSERRE
jgi:hypothetical protein